MFGLNPWALIGALLLAIGLAGGGYYEGWSQRGDHDAVIAQKEKDKLNAAHIAALEKLVKDRDAEHARGDQLAADLAAEKANVKTVTVQVVKEIPTVTTVYKETPNAPAQPIPSAVYTYGYLRLWNDAYSAIQLPGPGFGTGGAAGAAGETDLLKAPVTSADLLANHAENASKHADCYIQLNRLIDFELGRTKQPTAAAPDGAH